MEDKGLLTDDELATVTGLLDGIGAPYVLKRRGGRTWVLVTAIRGDALITQHDVDVLLEGSGFDLEWSMTRQIVQQDRGNNPTVVRA